MSEVTITGNAVEAPSLSYTGSGTAVTQLRIARNERYRDGQSGEWKTGAVLFVTVVCWRQLAEHVAGSVVKGTRVVVQGKLKQRQYEDKSQVIRETGEPVQRTVYEIQADDVSVSLRLTDAQVSKSTRSTQAEADAEDGPGPHGAEVVDIEAWNSYARGDTTE